MFVTGVLEWNSGNQKVGTVNAFLLEGRLASRGTTRNRDKEWLHFWRFLPPGRVLDLISWSPLKAGLPKKAPFPTTTSRMPVFVTFLRVDEGSKPLGRSKRRLLSQSYRRIQQLDCSVRKCFPLDIPGSVLSPGHHPQGTRPSSPVADSPLLRIRM